MNEVINIKRDKLKPIFFIFGFLIFFPLFINLSIFPVPIPIGSVLVLLLLIPLSLKIIIFNERLFFPKSWLFLIFAFIFSIFFSLIVGIRNSSLPISSILSAIQMILPTGSFFIFLYLLRSREIYISMIYGAFYAVLSFSILVLLSKNNLLLPGTFEVHHPVLGGGFEFYQFRQYAGTQMATGMLLGLFITKSKRNDLFLVICSFIVVIAVAEMYTSAGIIFALMSFMLIVYRYVGALKLILLVPIFIIFLFLLGFGNTIQEALSYEVSNIAIAGNRFDVWNKSIEIIENSPFFGNSFRFDSIFDNRMLLSHSQPLSLLTRAGIFAFLIWVGIIFNVFYKLYRLFLKPGSIESYHSSFLGLFLAIIQITLFAMVTTNFEQPYSGIIIWFYIALVERGHYFERK